MLVVEISRIHLYRRWNDKTEPKYADNTEIKTITEKDKKNMNYTPLVELLYSMIIFDNGNN